MKIRFPSPGDFVVPLSQWERVGVKAIYRER